MLDERGAQARTHGAGVTGAIECRYYGRDFTAGEMALLRALTAGPPAKTGPRAVPLGEAARALIDALPGPVGRRHACFRDMPTDGAFRLSRTAGARSARMRSSARYACTTFGTPPPVTPSCRAKTCPWSASCSGTGGTAPRPGYAHLADGHLVEAAERVGSIIVAAMEKIM